MEATKDDAREVKLQTFAGYAGELWDICGKGGCEASFSVGALLIQSIKIK